MKKITSPVFSMMITFVAAIMLFAAGGPVVQAASPYDLGTLTVDLSKGPTKITDAALGHFIFGAVFGDNPVINMTPQSSSPVTMWLDLDQNGSFDVEYIYEDPTYTLTELGTSSLTDTELTIHLSDAAISGLEADAKIAAEQTPPSDGSYYSSVTFILAGKTIEYDKGNYVLDLSDGNPVTLDMEELIAYFNAAIDLTCPGGKGVISAKIAETTPNTVLLVDADRNGSMDFELTIDTTDFWNPIYTCQ